ncbi:ABC transporter ATP-binding protein [Paenibacillus cellulosilyticus]|uniref:ABC transporter ATP-binding protein n=1 Tax=Paenibacillus cellulosilyticus TaxID=375489 RepID=UPI001FE866CA|nr:ABC transporter ATP-binding protein [Paenibacillus cellulosilyticus]
MAQIYLFIRKLHHFAGVKLYISFIGMLLCSGLEGVSILLLAPMLNVLGLFDSTSYQIPYISSLAAPLSHVSEDYRLPLLLALFVLLIMIKTYLDRVFAIMDARIEQGFYRQLQLEVYQGLMLSNWSFFLRKRKADFIHIATSELPRVNYGVYQSLNLFATFLFTIVQVGIAWMLSPSLTGGVLLCGILLALYSRTFVKKSRRLGEEATKLYQQYYAGMTDHLNGMKDIKSNGMEEKHISWFRSVCERIENNSIVFTRVQTTSGVYYKLASSLLLAGFIYMAYAVLKVEPAKLILISVIFSRLWPKFATLQSSWERLAQSLPAFTTLANLLKECEAAKELTLADLHLDDKAPRMTQGIECRGLYYRYGDNKTYALDNINLYIPANSMTAIVGKSGAGKSTLIDTLIGMVKPERGEVRIDGRPLISAEGESGNGNGSPFAFRQTVSYVSQEPFLFHATLRENLLIAAPDASEAQMWEALKFAASEEFVRRLPQGLDTELGDRGIRLSGGERQRIVLARAILRKPSVLILDEATSSLDSENEAHIQAALEKLKGSMTIIVIAHRLSTIRHVDQVLVLEQGRLIRQGGYQQLAAESDSVFGKLLSYQQTGYAAASVSSQ